MNKYTEKQVMEMEILMLSTMQWSYSFLSASEIFNFLVSSFTYYESNRIGSQVRPELEREVHSFIEIGMLMSQNPTINYLELALVATICFMDIRDIKTSRRFRKWIVTVLSDSVIGEFYNLEKVIYYRNEMLRRWLDKHQELGELLADIALMLFTEEFLHIEERSSPFGSMGCSTSDNTPERADANLKKQEEHIPGQSTQSNTSLTSHANFIAADIKLSPAGDLSFDENLD